MKDTDIMQFGKYKGKMLGNIPADYLIWLYDNIKGHSSYVLQLKEYIEDNMAALKLEIKASKPYFNDRQ